MRLKKLNRKLAEEFNGKVIAIEDESSRILSGELEKWDDIIRACQMAVDIKSGLHVVNDIKFTGGIIPKMRVPKISDNTLDEKQVDVLVIGGGISGTSILRELTKWNLKLLLVDKESDIAMQATGRNDGEVHPGVDLPKGLLKQHYVIKGNEMYEDICKELNVPFKRCGQYVIFTQSLLRPIAWLYALNKRCHCKVKGTKIIGRKKAIDAEPNINNNVKFALYNPTAGCVSPYNLAIAYAENAITNGAEISLNTAVLGMTVKSGEIVGVKTNRGTIRPKVVINAAGVFAEEIARMAGDRFYSIHPRRGTDAILDKKKGDLIRTVASIKELNHSHEHTKGGGMLNTVHKNILVGPNAVETYDKENYETSAKDIKQVFDKQRKTTPELSERDIITYFTGVRAPNFEEDFIIEKGRKTHNFIHVAGIQSPGLTTAPAVALDVEDMAIELLQDIGKIVNKNENFNPKRKGIPTINEMGNEEKSKYIAMNPDYGVIVCRCEQISKGEILDALNSPLCVPTVDGIKKRLRPGMGRCQGGFCGPLVAKLIADFRGVEISEVKKAGEESNLTFGKTKEGK